uniref:Uncharacterized protein n=1 Tax=Arundo donax TaxID=35708 RepID=A0A0A9GPL9_ARUDO
MRESTKQTERKSNINGDLGSESGHLRKSLED